MSLETSMPKHELSPEEMAAQQAMNAPESLRLTPREKAFMDRAHMTPAQLAQYYEWKKIDKETGGDQVL